MDVKHETILDWSKTFPDLTPNGSSGMWVWIILGFCGFIWAIYLAAVLFVFFALRIKPNSSPQELGRQYLGRVGGIDKMRKRYAETGSLTALGDK